MHALTCVCFKCSMFCLNNIMEIRISYSMLITQFSWIHVNLWNLFMKEFWVCLHTRYNMVLIINGKHLVGILVRIRNFLASLFISSMFVHVNSESRVNYVTYYVLFKMIIMWKLVCLWEFGSHISCFLFDKYIDSHISSILLHTLMVSRIILKEKSSWVKFISYVCHMIWYYDYFLTRVFFMLIYLFEWIFMLEE